MTPPGTPFACTHTRKDKKATIMATKSLPSLSSLSQRKVANNKSNSIQKASHLKASQHSFPSLSPASDESSCFLLIPTGHTKTHPNRPPSHHQYPYSQHHRQQQQQPPNNPVLRANLRARPVPQPQPRKENNHRPKIGTRSSGRPRSCVAQFGLVGFHHEGTGFTR